MAKLNLGRPYESVPTEALQERLVEAREELKGAKARTRKARATLKAQQEVYDAWLSKQQQHQDFQRAKAAVEAIPPYRPLESEIDQIARELREQRGVDTGARQSDED
jgi:hypothetical protein